MIKKRLIKLALICIAALGLFSGCGNRDIVDTNYTYDKAIIRLPNDEIKEIEIKKWRDYDGEQIQIIAKDGTVYLVSSFNTALVRE